MKQLFLDTANIDDIKALVQTEAIQGVTTNPSLMAKEAKGKYHQKLLDISNVLIDTGRKMHLSVEVITSDPKEMVVQALRLRDALHDDRLDLYVKIPILFETLPVITELSNKKVKVNATAAMIASQAKLAHDAGAPVISFFYNRMLDGGVPAEEEIHRFSDELNRNSLIICGSIRHASDVLKCWRNGADIVTAGVKVIKEMITHPKTDEAVRQFQKDIDTWLK